MRSIEGGRRLYYFLPRCMIPGNNPPGQSISFCDLLFLSPPPTASSFEKKSSISASSLSAAFSTSALVRLSSLLQPESARMSTASDLPHLLSGSWSIFVVEDINHAVESDTLINRILDEDNIACLEPCPFIISSRSLSRVGLFVIKAVDCQYSRAACDPVSACLEVNFMFPPPRRSARCSCHHGCSRLAESEEITPAAEVIQPRQYPEYIIFLFSNSEYSTVENIELPFSCSIGR